MTSIHQSAPSQRSRTGLIVGLAIGGAVVGIFCAIGTIALVLSGDSQDEPPPAAATGTTPGATGQPGDEQRLEITAELVDYEPASRFDNSHHTSVRVEVTNTSHERVYVGPLDWHGEDVDGFKHEPSYMRHVDALDGLYLDPGQAVRGVVTFEGEVELATIYYQRWPSDTPIPAPVD